MCQKPNSLVSFYLIYFYIYGVLFTYFFDLLFSKTRQYLRCNLLCGLRCHFGLLKDVLISYFCSLILVKWLLWGLRNLMKSRVCKWIFYKTVEHLKMMVTYNTDMLLYLESSTCICEPPLNEINSLTAINFITEQRWPQSSFYIAISFEKPFIFPASLLFQSYYLPRINLDNFYHWTTMAAIKFLHLQ